MQNNIGEARRSYALFAGKFTQEDAAEFFGVSVSTYKKWEQGHGMLNGVQLCKIADKYGVTTDYLLRRSDEPGRAGDAEDDERDIRLAGLLHSYELLNENGRERLCEEAEILNDSGRFC